MQRQIIITTDGSHSVAVPEMNVTYHSIHGALQESLHVFIEAGLHYRLKGFERPRVLNILEMGFGTGLNAVLTLAAVEKDGSINIHYTALELFPLAKKEYSQLNYCLGFPYAHLRDAFEQMHDSAWEKDIAIGPSFTLLKIHQSLLQLNIDRYFDLVYFDAFAPAVQPALWTKEVFKTLYTKMNKGGVLVTYCSKGEVRRNLLAAGFAVEKIPGPPRKREMLRAVKL